VATEQASERLWLTDSYNGRIQAYVGSDLAAFLNADRSWGYTGYAGQLGTGEGEFAYLRSVLVLETLGLLVAVDVSRNLVQAMPLSEVEAELMD
jgi:hypothetical protein